VERLLNPSKQPNDLVPFADPKKPLDSAVVVNFAELVSAAEPWVGYAIQHTGSAGDKKDSERVAAKVITTLKVLQRHARPPGAKTE
jgi:hypothetical protein